MWRRRVAIVETPHRLLAKEQLWNYASLAVSKPGSDGKSGRGHASKEGNRLLKKVLSKILHVFPKVSHRLSKILSIVNKV